MSASQNQLTNGWVAINRNVMELPDYFSQPFTLAMCLIDLTLLAEWKPRRSFCMRGYSTVLKRGQVAISIANLCKRWHLSKPTVMKRLDHLVAYGLIDTRPTATCTIITLCEYLDAETDSEEKAPDDDYDGLPLGSPQYYPADCPEWIPGSLPSSLPTSLPESSPECLHNTLKRKKKKEKEKEKLPSSSRAREELREGEDDYESFGFSAGRRFDGYPGEIRQQPSRRYIEDEISPLAPLDQMFGYKPD